MPLPPAAQERGTLEVPLHLLVEVHHQTQVPALRLLPPLAVLPEEEVLLVEQVEVQMLAPVRAGLQGDREEAAVVDIDITAIDMGIMAIMVITDIDIIGITTMFIETIDIDIDIDKTKQ